MKPKEKVKFIVIFYAVSLLVFLLYGSEIIEMDKGLFLYINQIRSPFLDYFFGIITIGGSTALWLLFIILLWAGGKRMTASFLLTALVVDSMALFGLKLLFNRPRPYETFPNLKVLDYELGAAFPSGHSERAFSGTTILASFYKRFNWVFYVLAVMVAVSRVYTGVHYPLDVIYGSINGILIGSLIIGLPLEKLKARLEKIFP